MAKGWSFSAFTEQIYNIIYPVGICIDFDNATNPNVAFPGTTWTQITDGRVPRSATTATVGTTEGQIGSLAGADTTTLTAANLPAHVHTMAHTHSIAHSHAAGTAASAGAHTHTYSATTSSSGAHTHSVSGTAASAGAHTHSLSGTAASAGAHAHQTSHLIDNKHAPVYGRTAVAAGAGIYVTTAGYSNVTVNGYYSTPTQNTGAHTHSISGTAASAGAHTHTVSGTAASAGAHTHTLSGTSSSAGAHTHSVSIPSFSGNSAASSAANTGSVGNGTAIATKNACHYYARWKRTA